MSAGVTKCSSEDCLGAPVDSLWLRGQVGHVHDCRIHAHDLREFCDVVESTPIVDGRCQAKVCTGDASIWFGQPAPLPVGDGWDEEF